MLGRTTSSALISLALSAALALSFAPAAAAQVTDIEYFKTGVFTQNSNDPPAASDFWSLSGRVLTYNADDLDSVHLSSPDVDIDTDLDHSGQTWIWFSPGYESREDLDAAYPDGTIFQFDLLGVVGTGTSYVTWAESLFVAQIPAFTGNTHADLQEMNPNLSFAVGINGFAPHPGATFSAIFVDIFNNDSGAFITSTIVEPDTTSIEIPAGTLLPDTNYQIIMYFSSRGVTIDPAFPPANNSSAYDYATRAYFHTRACAADLDGFPGVDLGDYFFFLNCFDATDSCADIDDQPGIDLGDFFAFFNAFDQSC